MQRCLSPRPWLSCDSMCLVNCMNMIRLLPRLTQLSVLLSFCPSEYAAVNITPSLPCFLSPLCAITRASFFHLSLAFSSCSPSRSLSLHPSCQLFIPCVNNCLPTVVIAPPCQLEVWSKWQCAQFSLAYIVQFLVSLVPFAKKKSPLLLQLCFICDINFWAH